MCLFFLSSCQTTSRAMSGGGGKAQTLFFNPQFREMEVVVSFIARCLTCIKGRRQAGRKAGAIYCTYSPARLVQRAMVIAPLEVRNKRSFFCLFLLCCMFVPFFTGKKIAFNCGRTRPFGYTLVQYSSLKKRREKSLRSRSEFCRAIKSCPTSMCSACFKEK